MEWRRKLSGEEPLPEEGWVLPGGEAGGRPSDQGQPGSDVCPVLGTTAAPSWI